MKVGIVYNTKDEPRLLLTLECVQDELRMANQPNLHLVTIETEVKGPTKLAYAIVPSNAFENYSTESIQPLSMAEMKNPAYAMGGGKSEADYQKFIMRYEATVEEALDAVLDSRKKHREAEGFLKDAVERGESLARDLRAAEMGDTDLSQLRDRIKELEQFEPPKCPVCEVYADNVGTEVTDEVWWCNGCDKDISQ
jgi:hypothetical protein